MLAAYYRNSFLDTAISFFASEISFKQVVSDSFTDSMKELCGLLSRLQEIKIKHKNIKIFQIKTFFRAQIKS